MLVSAASDDLCLSVPDSADGVRFSITGNNLDKPVRYQTEAAPLMSANVLPAAVERNQSLKVSNIEMNNLAPTEHQVTKARWNSLAVTCSCVSPMCNGVTGTAEEEEGQ